MLLRHSKLTSNADTIQIEKLPPLSDQLAHEMQKLDQMFWINQQKLKDISRQFEVELDRGLEEDNQNIVCCSASDTF